MSANATLWLGIDAGASHSEAVVLDGEQVVFRATAGPINHLMGAAGTQRMRRALRALMQPLPAALRERLAGVGLGLSGIEIPGKREQAEAMLGELAPGVPVHIASDLVTGLWGATGGADGVMLAMGTGSAAIARVGEEIVRAGGLGSQFSDEGSAYGIGVAGVRAALQALDGRGPETALVAALEEATGIRPLCALPGIAFAAWDAAQIARLAQAVALAAADGDAVATEILAAAGRELGSMAQAVLRRSGLAPEMALSGRGWKLSPIIWAQAKEAVRRATGRTATARTPKAGPAEGAGMYARSVREQDGN